MNIKKGDTFLCIQDFYMTDGSIAFKKGVIYTSDFDRCITNIHGNRRHIMHEFKPFSEYFRNGKEPVSTLDTKELLKRILELNEN